MTLKEKINSWFCLHSWKVDEQSSSVEHGFTVMVCILCRKTEYWDVKS